MKKIEIAVLTAFMMLISGTVAFAQSTQRDMMEQLNKFNRAVFLIEENYVDTVNFKKLADETLSQLMEKLDPHSVFIPAEDVQSTNEQLEGSFEGVGIEFAIISDTLSVQNVIIGGPSEAVGIHNGDKIVAVNGETIAGIGLTNDGVRSRLRGPRGTRVELTVIRRGVKGPLHFTVTRDRIPLNSVDAAYVAEPGILYVKLSRFAQNSAREMVQAFALLEEYPKGIIMDLRGNGGGYLQTAIQIANLFLSRGQVIVYTEGRNSRADFEYASGLAPYPTGPLVLLVDEDSASASEILSGAVQDWDRGIIVGRRTLGKGLVQRQFTLDDGSQIRLTVARYHTPSGRVIQSPYVEGHREEYYNKLEERYKHGEFFSADSISFSDSLKFQTLLLKRDVYGGGGIMPDYYIPADTTGVNSYYTRVVARGLLNDYVNEYCDIKREKLQSYKDSFEEFYNEYTSKMEDDAFDGLVQYCSKHDLKAEPSEINECSKLLKTRLKALVARSVFSTNGYYRVFNMEEDPAFDKALEVIKNWSPETFTSAR